MKPLQSQNRLIELMSRFVAQVKGATAIGRTDINRISELILVPLLSQIYNYANLKNLNYTEEFNYPGIDLGDAEAKISFQVTASADNEKIKDTLQKFAKYELYKKYDRLIIYILTERQKSYSGKGHQEIIQGKFAFDKDKDILDYRDLLKEISSFQIGKAHQIERILEANFGKEDYSLFQESEEKETETVHLNMLELFFPNVLYQADLAIDRKQIIRESWDRKKEYKRRLSWASNTREVAQAALEQLGLRFAVDWVCYKNKLITFHDLYDDDLALANIIDRGTITPIKPPERFCTINGEVNEDRERVFKSLLGRCLQQKLYHEQVFWQHKEKFFIFGEVNGEAERKEEWFGKREADHTVYVRTMKNNKPDEILNCKHLAFRTRYKRFSSQWYLLIKPDWFFSFDGYRRSFYCEDNLAWLKRQERNKAVYNHFRFIVYFLKHPKPRSLWDEGSLHNSFLSFGNYLSLDSAPKLDDNDWNPPKAKEIQSGDEGEETQESFDFEL